MLKRLEKPLPLYPSRYPWPLPTPSTASALQMTLTLAHWSTAVARHRLLLWRTAVTSICILPSPASLKLFQFLHKKEGTHDTKLHCRVTLLWPYADYQNNHHAHQEWKLNEMEVTQSSPGIILSKATTMDLLQLQHHFLNYWGFRALLRGLTVPTWCQYGFV